MKKLLFIIPPYQRPLNTTESRKKGGSRKITRPPRPTHKSMIHGSDELLVNFDLFPDILPNLHRNRTTGGWERNTWRGRWPLACSAVLLCILLNIHASVLLIGSWSLLNSWICLWVIPPSYPQRKDEPHAVSFSECFAWRLLDSGFRLSCNLISWIVMFEFPIHMDRGNDHHPTQFYGDATTMMQ